MSIAYWVLVWRWSGITGTDASPSSLWRSRLRAKQAGCIVTVGGIDRAEGRLLAQLRSCLQRQIVDGCSAYWLVIRMLNDRNFVWWRCRGRVDVSQLLHLLPATLALFVRRAAFLTTASLCDGRLGAGCGCGRGCILFCGCLRQRRALPLSCNMRTAMLSRCIPTRRLCTPWPLCCTQRGRGPPRGGLLSAAHCACGGGAFSSSGGGAAGSASPSHVDACTDGSACVEARAAVPLRALRDLLLAGACATIAPAPADV